MRRKIFSLVLIAIMGLGCFVFTSCQDEEVSEPVVRETTTPPVTEVAPPELPTAPPVAQDGGAETEEVAPVEGVEGEAPEATEGETTPEDTEAEAPGEDEAEPGTESTESTEAVADEAETAAEVGDEGEEAAEAVSPDVEALAGEMLEQLDEVVDETGAVDMDALADLAGEMTDLLEPGAGGAELTAEQKIENFRNLDPRTIITAKYDDLKDMKTEPWDEEDPDNYIPQTGRPDPLTIVSDAVPDVLKPTRTGETDQNEIDTYFVAAECTAAVETLGALLDVHNVIEIGTEKYCTLGIQGQRFTVPAGGGNQFVFSQYGSIAIVAGFTVSSITTEQVIITISAYGQGTTTNISENKIYIPRIS